MLKDPNTEQEKVVAHMAIDGWPKGAETHKSHEIRAVVVDESYRNKLIYAYMSAAVIEKMFNDYPGTTLIEVKNGMHGLHLLKWLGFVECEPEKAHADLGLDVFSPEWKVYTLAETEECISRIHEVKGLMTSFRTEPPVFRPSAISPR